jgi:hypothetical protein
MSNKAPLHIVNSWLIQLQMTIKSSDLAAAWSEASKVDANALQSPLLLLGFYSRCPTYEAAASTELGYQRPPVLSFLSGCFFVRAVLGDVELGRNASGISGLLTMVSRGRSKAMTVHTVAVNTNPSSSSSSLGVGGRGINGARGMADGGLEASRFMLSDLCEYTEP